MTRIGGLLATSTAAQSPQAEKIMLEVDTKLGRDVFELDLNNRDNPEKLRFFLQGNGFKNADPQEVIDRAKASHAMMLDQDIRRCRLEKLGFERDCPLALPRIGQAHELEFPGLRSRIPGQAQVSHAALFASSSTKLNEVSEMQIVSETLGEKIEDATTEVILGPASTREEYFDVMAKVQRFRARVESEPSGTRLSMAEAFGAAYEGSESHQGAQAIVGEIWRDVDEDMEGPCVHTSRGTPIRAISSVLQEPQSRLSKEAKQMLKFAASQTDTFVVDAGLRAPRGRKLWETLNLAIWMAACEGVLHPLMPDDHAIDSTNKTMKNWTKYAGKNFFGVVSRFTAGDLLRSGGLQIRDVEQIRTLFAGPNISHNSQNFERIVQASENAAKSFVAQLESSQIKEHRDIAALLHSKWHFPPNESVMHWIRRDLKIDFMPNTSPARYPDDTDQAYGRRVIAHSASPSYAHSQFVPRRERLGADPHSKAPVAGAFEFRAGEYVGNARIDAHFARGKKRTRNELEASWTHFEKYVDRVSKRPKTAEK